MFPPRPEVPWPAATGPRIYAYLKPFPALPNLLQTLTDLQFPAIIGMAAHDAPAYQKFNSPSLRIETRFIHLGQILRECDLTILSGTHILTARSLLAGKPVLVLPFVLEFVHNARAAERLGAGLAVSPNQPALFREKIEQITSTPSYAEAACRFAVRYADFQHQREVDQVTTQLEALL